MACIDCLDNCTDPNLSDKCVKSTLEDNETIGICEDASLFTNMTAIVEYLGTLINGTGISLSGLTGCSYISPSSTALSDIVQALYDAVCGLKTTTDSLQDQITPAISFNTDCLEGLPASPSRDQILQATLSKVCDIDGRLEDVEADYVRSADLCGLIQDCIAGTPSSVTQEYTKMPKYVALPYHGPLSAFDSQGAGLSSAGYEKVYLCLGQVVNSFTLPDYRGRSPIGVNAGLPGGAMDSAVNPANIANAGYSISTGAKKGAYTHTITATESNPHTHVVNDPGHAHTYNTFDTNNGGSLPNGFATNHSTHYTTPVTSSATTGITISSSGGGQAHNNTHPVIGAVFIIYIP
jgi:microcystin-dependent protein